MAETDHAGILASQLREYLAGSLGFYRLDELLVQKGICRRADFHGGGKRTEIYARQAPNVLVMLQIPDSGLFSRVFRSRPAISVYASGDYETLEQGLKFSPQQHMRMERLAVLDARTAEGELNRIKSKLKEKVDNTPKNSFVFDLHTHCAYGESITSGGYVTPEKLVEYAWFRTGLDGVALVPHYTKKGDPSYLGLVKAEKALKEIEGKLGIKKRAFVLLRGFEYCVERDSHVIAIFPENVDPKSVAIPEVSWKLPDAIGFVHDHGGLVIAAHPFLKGSGIGEDAVEANKKALDGIEVKNGALIEMYPSRLREAMPSMKSMNERAEELGKKLKKENPRLALTGGSDAHVAWHIGICTTRIEAADFTYENIFEAIKKGNTTPYGNYMNYLNYPKRMIVGGFAGQLRKIIG